MSAFRAALLRFGYGEWAFVDGVLVRVARAATLTLSILCIGVADISYADEPELRVSAAICVPKGRQVCHGRASFAFAPARVSVYVYVRHHPDNRHVQYGLVCDGVPVHESIGEGAPVFTREYRDVGQGTCVAAAVLVRADGSQVRAQSGPLDIRASLEGGE